MRAEGKTPAEHCPLPLTELYGLKETFNGTYELLKAFRIWRTMYELELETRYIDFVAINAGKERD